MNNKPELWKELEGYEGRYFVSSYGRVWNTAVKRMMKPQLKKSGYLQLNLVKPDKKIVTVRVHRLVATCFCERPYGCDVVNHLDMNKTNNRADNLEWTTVSGNTKHCYDNNADFRKQLYENSIKGAKKTILTLEIRDKDGLFIGNFQGYQKAAENLGINEKTVRNILNGKFRTNRKGYNVKVIARGGMLCEP